MNQIHVQDDSQVALRVAMLAALVSAALFVGISIIQTVFPSLSHQGLLEIFAKSVAVITALIIAHTRIEEASHLQNRSHIPFLSTFFFY